MLFYAVLTIAGILVAAIVVWMLRSIMTVSRSTYRSMSPSARNAGEPRLAHLNSHLAATPAPWGWGGGKRSGASGRASSRRATLGDRVASNTGARRNETYKERLDRENARSTTVRSVLSGYDIDRSTEPDTSCWPYQEKVVTSRSTLPTDNATSTSKKDGPSKPWGW